jgi:hypothetical protein
VAKLPDPWQYFALPDDHYPEVYRLYNDVVPTHIEVKHIEQVLYPSTTGVRDWGEKETYAIHAARFFIIGDFIASYYKDINPTFRLKPVPPEVLQYLGSPYCWMADLNLDAQKQFRDALPRHLQGLVEIDG